jgi:hypothetical protein
MIPLAFRNISATPADPIELWGYVGLETCIERGSLKDLSKIKRFIREHPEHEIVEQIRVIVDSPSEIQGARAAVRLWLDT